MTLPIYNQHGEEVGKVDLDPKVFGLKAKPELIQQVVVAEQANARGNIAHTKTRGEVRGGGKKPWKQKGTGRARHGSIRSPLWKGGGVTFGPRKDRNFSQKVNKKVKRQALLMSLSEKILDQGLKVLEDLNLEKIKTKQMAEVLQNLQIRDKKILLALEAKDDVIIKSARNLPKVQLEAADSLNVIDVLWADVLVTTVNGVKMIEKIYG
jgi:large subunit ribosomal protein L4